MEEENTKTMDIVRDILAVDPKARNDDKWLIIQVCKKHGLNFVISYEELKDIPAFETITRCRRHIQNSEGLYLANKNVEEGRKIEQQNFKTMFSNSQYY